MSTTNEHRKEAERLILDVKAHLVALPASDTRDKLIAECAALAVSIAAFHMEGIRFRMFNVDRLLSRGGITVPPEATTAFAETRRHLEAAGFHTRSHQAP